MGSLMAPWTRIAGLVTNYLISRGASYAILVGGMELDCSRLHC